MPLNYAYNCPECDAPLIYIVDGVEMTYTEIIKLPSAPMTIRRDMIHKLWCTKMREY